MDFGLRKLKIENFKGIKNLEVNFSEKTTISGMNATGKTTVFDSFSWLLFGKDSKGSANFSVKPLDMKNNEIHNIDVSVYGEFEIDGKILTLSKTMKEKWVKKRGSLESEFGGHETEYSSDGIPVKQKEYKEIISKICDESLFSLITDPTSFPNLHWTKQREILMQIVGDIDCSTIETDEINNLLDGKSVDERKKQLVASRKLTNEKIDNIPVRIDELKRSIEVLEEPEERKEVLENRIELLRLKKETVSSDLFSRTAYLRAQIQSNSVDQMEIDSKLNREIEAKKSEINRKIFEIKNLISSENREYDENISKNKFLEEKIDFLIRFQSDKRSEWNELRGLTWSGEKVCPTCRQNLPVYEIHNAIERFENQRKQKLAKINEEGKKLSDQIKELKSQIVEVEKHDHAKKEKDIENLEIELSGISIKKQDYDNLECNKELNAELLRVQEMIRNETDSVFDRNKEIDSEISEIKKEIAGIDSYFAKKEAQKATIARIKELEEEQKRLAEEYVNIEKSIFLLEEYTRAKVELVEAKVNSIFSLISFKLFKQNINGGIEDTCEITVNGVPFGTGLNTGTRINAGLEMCNRLQEFHGVSAPVFIDNAESVTELFEMNCQIVKLFHDGEVSKLTITEE